MHIGGSSAFAAIGAVDSPIIKDVRTNLPMIPGSSFKGKMRALLAKEYNEDIAKKPDDDAECLLRLFGCAKFIGKFRIYVLRRYTLFCTLYRSVQAWKRAIGQAISICRRWKTIDFRCNAIYEGLIFSSKANVPY
jgi:CRISPR/Cas system CSM-associated protein Csm3 (group 7 of RAMP superfamily)